MFCPKGDVGPATVGTVPPGSWVPTVGCVVTTLCPRKGKGKVLPYPPVGICKFGAVVGTVLPVLGLPVGN
jgi:hypothetical protein